MNTCKTCKHWISSWRTYSGTPDSRPACGGCDSPKMRQGYENGFGARGNGKPDEAVIETDEGWGMETGPDFGCVHWEAK